MEKYATSFKCSEREADDLVRRLKTEGFQILHGMYQKTIAHNSSRGKDIGYFEKHFDDQLLYIFETADNPLAAFMKKYKPDVSAPESHS